MRIISGKFKNKKLHFPNNIKTRPLKDSVRENIFNILCHSNNFNINIQNSNILDLYSGSGSFGLECLSRGASKVFFVEQDKDALTDLKKNIENIGLKNKTFLYPCDVSKFFQKKSLKSPNDKFNIIFLDPPYKNTEFLENIKIIKIQEITNNNHIFVIHREIKSENKLKDHINIIDKRVYGRSEIFFGKLF